LSASVWAVRVGPPHRVQHTVADEQHELRSASDPVELASAAELGARDRDPLIGQRARSIPYDQDVVVGILDRPERGEFGLVV